MEEVWKDIPGYEGLYQVSNFGKIKALPKIKITPDGRVGKTKEIILKENDNNFGYKSVSLSKNCKKTRFRIHRLVAEAFLENPNNYKEVNHKDENKSNNNVNNLEWCTRSYNAKYFYQKRREENGK